MIQYAMKFLRQKSFAVFMLFELLYESSRWRFSNIHLRESMMDSVKVFLQMSACLTCYETFLPQNVRGIWY